MRTAILVTVFSILALVASGAIGTQAAAAADPVAAVRDRGGLVQPIALADTRFDVALHLASEPVTDEVLQQLVTLNESNPIAWLNLAGTDITDAGCDLLAKLTGLERLHLERTAITDAGLAKLAPLVDLTYLNVYGTKVTDASLPQLAAWPKLSKAYVWQTGVTEDAITKFRSEYPSIDLIGAVKLLKIDPPKDKPADGEEADEKEADEKKDAENAPKADDAKDSDAENNDAKSKDAKSKDAKPNDAPPATPQSETKYAPETAD